MADFCKRCSQDLFGFDTKELAGLCQEGEVVSALCEECGWTYVDHEGRCTGGICDILQHKEDN